ncbi:MAG: HEPN domain-containing protein [Rhodospirillales bacterium]|jgi:uncharacterized protein (UPF0332 family)|nr:HEPN domain-containing protein [Rhodospirillales bacterium]HIJ44485.1 HEPN domain-containing protein [Rhodospirillaceae bacterium]MDP7098778.1 HEPN domain-containing protein [Rhodospirillales bacterium]MDP7215523.1 HEPN domain-containing protein [Rhodospirillales bacterium]HIJ46006.1 HEPN domain-containing protein [Rhodospirillaceae bacterium]
MNKEQNQLLSKAEENIEVANLLFDKKFPEISVSRAYYAMFYLATAMLIEKGLRFSRHSAIAAAFGREITKQGLLPVDLHGWLLDAANARNASDYRIDRAVSLKEAAEHIERAERFLEEVRRVLEKEPENNK